MPQRSVTEYKLVVVGGGGAMTWQPGANRKLRLSEEDCSNGSVLIYVPWEQEEGERESKEREEGSEKGQERGGEEASIVAADEEEWFPGKTNGSDGTVARKKKVPQTANLLLVSAHPRHHMHLSTVGRVQRSKTFTAYLFINSRRSQCQSSR